ncbi:unnamed protein product [marine sediment metagenome]|uniref:Nuclease associated modular domain-containing protein n=1 Tax=marine sediment metagenome TaxID=412755 RepID=X0ZQE0_9ZZZZ
MDKDSLLIHSLDGNHENWKPENKVAMHFGCHTIFHNKNRPRKIVTPETRKKISQSLKGRILSPEHRRNISEAQRGEKHYNWKGDKAKKASIRHRRYIERRRKKLV